MIEKLQVVQNKVVRFVLDLGPRSRINWDILDKVNMRSVTDRVRQLRINHVFNIFHGHAPEYLCANFNLNNNLTRGATNLFFLVSNENTSLLVIKIVFFIMLLLTRTICYSISKIFLTSLHSNQQLTII